MKKTFHKTIVFTKVPLKGFFRYEDMFQIYPLDLPNMPFSKLQPHFPLVLEYWTSLEDKIEVETAFEELKESFSQNATSSTKQDRILSLLSLFTNHLFFRYTDFEGVWGMPILDDNPGYEAELWATKWIMTGGFTWPEMAGHFHISDFTAPLVNEVQYLPHKAYYADNPNCDTDHLKEILFPEIIFVGLAVYFSLPNELKSIVDSAVYYSVSAMEIYAKKKTLSLLASFTAMETMVNLEFRDVKSEKCEQCGQLKYGVVRKYREYLLKYIGDTPHNKKKFNAYYSLRSKIVHTGEKLKTEHLYHNLPEEERQKEYLTRIEILQIGKLALINWLIKNAILIPIDET